MCNFHEAVAVSAATDPVTGKLHAGHKAVIRVALSRYWAERYVDGAEDVNGYNPYPLATQEQQAAFARSGLSRPADTAAREEERGLAFLRAKIAELERHQDLSTKGLRLPPATAREPFMDLAIANIYTGDPRGKFDVAASVDRKDLQPLHRAVSFLHQDAQTRDVLESLVKGKICTLYTQAPSQVNRTLVDAYEKLPTPVRKASETALKYGGNVVLGGFSGILGHGVHYGSVIGAGLASGTAASANIALSAVFLAASYGGWQGLFGGRYKSAKQQVNAFAVQAGLTLAIAFGAQSMMSHDHLHSERAEWYQSLPPEMRDSLTRSSRESYNKLPEDLRAKLDSKASEEGVPPEVFLLVCDGSDPLTQEIAAYNASKAGQPEPKAP